MQNSVWLEEYPTKVTFPALGKNLTADIVIIGGGITGLTVAYLLQKAGKKIVLLEKSAIGSGETGYTTAFITHVVDYYLQDIVKTFDEKTGKLVWESGKQAIDLIERIVTEEKIECEFRRCPALVYTQTNDIDTLKKEAEMATKLGFNAIVRSDNNLGFQNNGYLEVHSQATFEPLAYIKRLAQLIAKKGGQIFEQTMVDDIEENSPLMVHANSIKIEATHVVMATHNPLTGMILQDKILPYQTYVIAAEVSNTRIPPAILWDTVSPYHYLRVDKRSGSYRIILGGEDHPTGKQPKEDPYQKLQSYLGAIGHKDAKIITTWSGQVLETNDGLPYIGKTSSSNLYCGTGYSGNGMTYGTISGMLISDLILGKKNPYSEIYNPQRITKKLDFVAHGFKQLGNFVKDRLPSGKDFDDIQPGTGKVIHVHGQKAAVFRDKDGKLTVLSATCTHLGCIVQWNEKEATWDCPCHGSRFAKDGTVIRGPAQKPLPPVA